MEAYLVLIAERDRDAALGILGVRFAEFELGQTEHTPVCAQFDCSPHAGDAGARDNEVCFLHKPSPSHRRNLYDTGCCGDQANFLHEPMAPMQANISLQQRTIEQLRAFGGAALE